MPPSWPANPGGVVVEDAHWIDEVSESMLADFLTVIPQTPSLVLVTYRPEYEGALTRVHGRDMALELLRQARDAQVLQRNLLYATVADIRIAELTAEGGEVQGAIQSARSIVDQFFENGEMFLRGVATAALVETLLRRGSDTDVQEAAAAIGRFAAVPTDPGFVLNEIPLLRMRALLARAHGDETGYRDYRDRYRAMARTLGFEGHIAWAEAMT